MIGVGASVISYSCGVPLSSNEVVTESVQDGIDSVTDNGDGTTTIVLPGGAPSDRFDVDTVDFYAAQLAGLPFFLEAPAVTSTDNSTYTSDFQARYISTGGESVDALPVLCRGGQIVPGWEPENGTSYTVDVEGIDEFLQVQLGVALFSPSGGDTPVTSLTEIQAATPHTPKSSRAMVDPSFVQMDWSGHTAGDPAAPVEHQRFIAGLWFRRSVPNNRWIWDADNEGASPETMSIQLTNGGKARMSAFSHSSFETSGDAPIQVGDRVCVVFSFEVGGFAQAFTSLNGADFVVGDANPVASDAPGIITACSRTYFFSRIGGSNRFSGGLERMEFFSPAQITNPQDIKSSLVTPEGRSPIHGLARKAFGDPIFAFDGDPARLNALDFDGTFNPTNLALTGQFESAET